MALITNTPWWMHPCLIEVIEQMEYEDRCDELRGHHSPRLSDHEALYIGTASYGN